MNWSIRPFHNLIPCIVYMEFSLKGGAIYGLWLRRRMLRRLGWLPWRIRRRIRLWRRIRACCGSIHSFNYHRRLLRLLNEQEGGFKAPLSFCHLVCSNEKEQKTNRFLLFLNNTNNAANTRSGAPSPFFGAGTDYRIRA
jgi:hypothetical protein